MTNNAQAIKGIELLQGEAVRYVLDCRAGPVAQVPLEGDYLVLTSRRVIGAWKEEIRRKRVVMDAQRVDSIALTEQDRDPKPLLTGGLFIVAGVLVPWAAILLNLNGVIAWLLGMVLVLLGAVTASGYLAREYVAILNVAAGGGELALPLRTAAAARGAYGLVNAFFSVAQEAGREPAPSLAARGVYRWSNEAFPAAAPADEARETPPGGTDAKDRVIRWTSEAYPAAAPPANAATVSDASPGLLAQGGQAERQVNRWTNDAPLPRAAPQAPGSPQLQGGDDV